LRVSGELGVSITKLPLSFQAKAAVETSKMAECAVEVDVYKRSRVLEESLLDYSPELSETAKQVLID